MCAIWPGNRARAPYQATLLPSGFVGQDINDAGQIVGNTRESEAWIWSERGIVNLSLLIPGVQAFAINNRGDVAGNYSPADASALIYSNGTFRDIGRVPGLNYATPRAINDKGQVAGTAGNFPGDTSRPFFYDGATMTGIGTFGGDQGDALALNDKGTVVGNAALAPPPDSPYGARQPFVYRDGILSELRTSQAMVYSANDINDTGGGSPEDFAEPLLGELGLLQEVHKGQYAFRRGPKASLRDGIFAYALVDFWNRKAEGQSSLAFVTVAYAEGSPGRVFKLDDESIAQRLIALSAVCRVHHSLSDTALDCNPFVSSSRPPMYNPDVVEVFYRVINAAVNPMEPWDNIAEFFPSETDAA